MYIITLAIGILYTLVILSICGFLLSRGLTHSFILWFGGGAALELVPRLGYFLLNQMPGGLGANMRWMPAFTALGMLGTLCFLVGFALLAAYLIKTKPADA